MRLALCLSLTLGAVLFSAGCASTNAPAEPVRVAAAGAPGPTTNRPGFDKDEVVCRDDKVTGSRFGRRICHTRAEWERMRQAGVEGTKKAQESPVPIISN